MAQKMVTDGVKTTVYDACNTGGNVMKLNEMWWNVMKCNEMWWNEMKCDSFKLTNFISVKR